MNNPTTRHSPLPALLACAATGCLSILAIYGLLAPNPIIARLPYALLISGVSLVIAWPIAARSKLTRKWTVAVYVMLFLLIVLLQAGLR